MSKVKPQEEVTAGDDYIRYKGFELAEDDLKVRNDHFWHKIFSKTDKSRDRFVILPKKVKCTLVLSHSNANVDRSLHVI